MFVLFIVAGYIVLYFQKIVNERDHWHAIAVEQQRIMNQQNDTLSRMKLMFELLTGDQLEDQINNPLNSPGDKRDKTYVHPI